MVLKVRWVLKDSREILDQLAKLVRRVLRAFRVRLGILVLWVRKDLRVTLDHKVLRAFKV